MTLSLLREKFCIRDIASDKDPLIVLGNRLQIPMGPNNDEPPLVIRCHSLYMALRLVAAFIKDSSYTGLNEDVAATYQWTDKWEDLIQPFEKIYAPDTWVAVYNKGRCLFESGTPHHFFDLIEHCQFSNRDKYDYAVEMAQAVFKKAGKPLLIEHESHVGYVQEEVGDAVRMALVLRMPGQKATFTIHMQSTGDDNIPPPDYQAMQTGANFIEAISRAIQAGFTQKTILSKKLSPTSKEGKEHKETLKRLAVLESDIKRAESRYDIRYRPEKPDFKAIQEECLGH